jgi:translation initiation factor IF-3
MNATPTLAVGPIIDVSKLKTAIDKLDINHHIHIGSMLRQHSAIKLNVNKSGILVNFSTIPDDVLNQIKTYVDYVADQEQLISKMESSAEELKQFIPLENSNKDNFGIMIN